MTPKNVYSQLWISQTVQ